MDLILDEAASALRIGLWKHPAVWVLPPSAFVELRPGLNACVVRVGDVRCRVELWSGAAGSSPGIAVLGDDEPEAVTTIPLCGCGERECGHSGRHFAATIAVVDLPTLFERLTTLPHRHVEATPDNVWLPGRH